MQESLGFFNAYLHNPCRLNMFSQCLDRIDFSKVVNNFRISWLFNCSANGDNIYTYVKVTFRIDTNLKFIAILLIKCIANTAISLSWSRSVSYILAAKLML